jgi:hypothetical protein
MGWMNEKSCVLAQTKDIFFQNFLTDSEDRQAYGCLAITGDFSAGKQSGHMTDHSLQSGVEVNSGWSRTFPPP